MRNIYSRKHVYVSAIRASSLSYPDQKYLESLVQVARPEDEEWLQQKLIDSGVPMSFVYAYLQYTTGEET